MASSIVILLAIALVALYVRYQFPEEIVVLLSNILSIFCVLMSFALAPWKVQILILVVGLLGMRYFCYRHSCQQLMKDHQKG